MNWWDAEIGDKITLDNKTWVYAGEGVWERDPISLVGWLQWQEIEVPYKTNVVLADLTEMLNGEITSTYLQVTAFFGGKYNGAGKKVSMSAMRISEFSIHEDYSGGLHAAEIKTQHNGVYCKYADSWTNMPDVLLVYPGNIRISIVGTNVVVYHEFDKGEDIEPTLSCRYRLDVKQIIFP